jgi:cyclase
VASIDARRRDGGGWEVFTRAGTRPTGLDPVTLARRVEAAGAGEVLITSIERDGTMRGYDVDLIAAVAQAVSIPVIASGGAGSYADLLDAVVRGGASAVAAAAMYHYTQQTPREAKLYLKAHGVQVRV